MSHRFLLPLLGLALVGLAVLEGGWYWLAAWLGCDFLILGVAHIAGLHGVLGKKPDGHLPVWSWVLFFPMLMYTSIVWHSMRWLSREPDRNTVTDELVVGRRMLAGEFQDEFDNFVDLTAEFPEPSVIRRSPAYRSFPILDGAAPEPESLRAAIVSLRPGRTFVHCAQGHGRTGLFALAMLLSSGVVHSVDEGMRILTKARPGIRLNHIQLACAQAFAKGMD